MSTPREERTLAAATTNAAGKRFVAVAAATAGSPGGSLDFAATLEVDMLGSGQ